MPSGTSHLPGPISEAVAEIIFEEIKLREGLSQAEVARASDMSTSQLSRVLNGHKVFTLEELDRVCFALGREIAEVIDQADRASSQKRRKLAPVTPISRNVSTDDDNEQQDAAAAKKRRSVKDKGSDEGF